MEFPKKRSLAKHIKEHLKQEGEETADKAAPRKKKIRKSKEAIMWACDDCKMAFYKLASLKKHNMKEHGRES